ncbi:MAG: acyltransferase family protein [Xanthobacteraceae bacterium]
MFGTLRLLLAYLVVVSHLMGSEYFVHFGLYAVQGFFVVSGFIITAALNEVYRFDGSRFWANRLLRLLPLYYVVCLATLAVVAFWPKEAGDFLPTWQRGAGENYDVLLNLLAFPLQFGQPPFRLVPPFWSVVIEIEMYLLLWIVIARREAYAAIALAAGVAYHLACMFNGHDWTLRYVAPPSALLAFPLGALLYFWKKRDWFNVGPATASLAFAAWTGNMMAAGLVFSTVYDVGYYLNVAFLAVLVAGLARVRLGTRIHAFDKALGDMAYPLFLAHWLVGFLVSLAFFPQTSRGLMLTLVATPAGFIAAFGLAEINRRFTDPVRDYVRGMMIDRSWTSAEARAPTRRLVKNSEVP